MHKLRLHFVLSVTGYIKTRIYKMCFLKINGSSNNENMRIIKCLQNAYKIC